MIDHTGTWADQTSTVTDHINMVRTRYVYAHVSKPLIVCGRDTPIDIYSYSQVGDRTVYSHTGVEVLYTGAVADHRMTLTAMYKVWVVYMET